ncbi:MAG: branched-chain amino acid ABC transporter permease [Microcoleaceae cyanobacterium MO_207.B10]|nr:branched-chain amino acid ABC transporter permease [Microcoleaceae cyanobacterium MO_207.B10]
MSDKLKLIPPLLTLIFLLLLPLFTSPFNLILLTEILLMALFSLSFNLLFGYGGLLSFGHAGYFATGAYVSAYLIKASIPIILAIPIAVITAFLVAIIIGYFSVRVDKIYFAMLTLAFGMMIYTILFQWREVTGGSDGITGVIAKDLGIPGLPIKILGFTNYYYVTLIIVAIATYILWRIIRSPFGEILQASRENPIRLQFVGIDVRHLRWIAFAIAGGMAGLAGALWSPFQRVANPEIAHWSFSAIPVLMTILGGASRFAGPIVGATVFLLLEHWVQSYQANIWQWLATLPIFSPQLAQQQIDLWNLLLGLLLIPLILGFRGGLFIYLEKFAKIIPFMNNFHKNNA